MSNKIQEFINNNIMTTIVGKEIKLSDFFKEEDFIQDDAGNIFVKLEGLIRVSRKVFHHIVSLDTEIKQQVQKTNDWYAVIKATIEIEQENPDSTIKIYKYSAHADCYKGNTPEGNAGKYYVCMAETRAISRVLRNILGIPACSVEEVAEISDLNSVVSTTGPIEPSQKMLIERKFIGEKNKTLEDISKIVGKAVNSLDVLTKEDATLVIQNLNKGK